MGEILTFYGVSGVGVAERILSFAAFFFFYSSVSLSLSRGGSEIKINLNMHRIEISLSGSRCSKKKRGRNLQIVNPEKAKLIIHVMNPLNHSIITALISNNYG